MLLGWSLVILGSVLFATRLLRSRWQPHVVVATFSGYAPVPLSIGTAALLFTGQPWLGGVLILLLVLVVQSLPLLKRRRAGDPVLTILTANLWCGRGDPAVIVALVRCHSVDVVALQELTPSAMAALGTAGLDALLPHRIAAPAPDWEGAGLWSRYPLREQEVSRRGTLYRASAVIAVTGTAHDADPRITSVHVHAPWPGPAAPWVDQLAELGRDFAIRTRPTVVAGDFNATHGHASFRLVLRQCTDVAATAWPWRSPTYPQHLSIPALICIDHVLLGDLTATAVSTHAVPGADHRAVIASVARDVREDADGVTRSRCPAATRRPRP
jgi:endonuclease/exonuclease/phosphatase (EEP) superfamily protein YafD